MAGFSIELCMVRLLKGLEKNYSKFLQFLGFIFVANTMLDSEIRALHQKKKCCLLLKSFRLFVVWLLLEFEILGWSSYQVGTLQIA